MNVRVVAFVAGVPWLAACGSSSGSSAAETGDAAPPPCATVMTHSGPVEGSNEKQSCSYMGIPYAAPPVGPLRWKAPQPVASWTAPRPSKAASTCPQGSGLLNFGQPSTDEDCLYLNVWVPDPRPSSPAPVMVFVHGGGFTFGSGTFSLYDGANLANATGAIIVTMNYRLGAFGFLSNAALRAEDPAHPSAGNYALEDQIASFQWVKTNIAAFGGDTSRITVFGESAGGTSMFDHLASPKSAGLFARMIVESGWCPEYAAAQPQTMADQAGANLAMALGCTDPASLLSCLRGKSASDVLNAIPDAASDWFPVVDGFVLPKEPLAAISAGSFNDVPVILGNNANEGTLFVQTNPPTTQAAYQSYVESLFPGHGAAIVAQYPASAYGGSYQTATATVMADGQFVCPARRVARGLVKAGKPTYRYEFRHAVKFILSGLGAFHASELFFVFDNTYGVVNLQGQGEAALSQEMMGYWGAMATGGDPNGGGRLDWPAYDATSEKQIVLDLTLSTESAYEKSQCDFWDSLYAGG